MEKNYYDILEVNKNASQEIIDRAYKVLVKKYHPDLQTDPVMKSQCEEKLKEINEAYETLSDEQKRKEYDDIAFNNTSDNYYTENNNESYYNPSTNTNTSQNSNTNANNNIYEDSYRRVQEQMRRQEQEYYEQQMQNAVNKAYYDAYVQDLKNRGYKIRYKKTFKDYVRSFVAILITLFIIVLIWQIPFVQNYFIGLYNENEIIKFLVDVVLSIFGMK